MSTVLEPVTLPHDYAFRSYVWPVWNAFSNGSKRLLLLWHRRAIKTTTAAHIVARAAIETVATYYIITPTFALGRRIWWDGLDYRGKRMLLSVFPPEYIASFSESEMQITLVNGSVVQLIGADEPNRLVRGPGVRGVVFDEYSVMDSAHPWNVLQPILIENGGWALFCFTPLGKNHASALYEMAIRDPAWFVSRLTVADTRRDAPGEDGSPVVDKASIAEAIAQGFPTELAEQEFYLSFIAAMPGTYYAKELTRAEKEGRLSERVLAQPGRPVHTVMDLGISDQTVIIFFQLIGTNVHLVHVEAHRGEGPPFYVSLLQRLSRERDWKYGTHFAPHDANTRDSSATTLKEQYRQLRVHLRVIERRSVVGGIADARHIFPRCWFDRESCRELVDALGHYRSDWIEAKRVMKLQPVHDWASDYADSFRYLSQAVAMIDRREDEDRRPREQRYATSSLSNPWGPGAGISR